MVGARVAEGDTGRMVFREAVEAVVLLMYPFAPHVTEELWERLGGTTPLYATPWPSYDEGSLEVDEITVVVQVNGKVRSKVVVPAGADDAVVRAAVEADAKIREWTEGKTVRKFIYVPGKIANLVVS